MGSNAKHTDSATVGNIYMIKNNYNDNILRNSFIDTAAIEPRIYYKLQINQGNFDNE